MNGWEWLKGRIPRVRANISRNQERRRSPKGRVATVLVCVLAGLMIHGGGKEAKAKGSSGGDSGKKK